MSYEVDEAIAVQPQGDGVYAANLEEGWKVGGGLNGGYLLAVIGNAIKADLEAAGHHDPYTISAYYLSPSVAGSSTVTVRRIRQGRGSSTVSATLSQIAEDGSTVDRITALATFGDLERISGDIRTTAKPPALPAVDECVLTSLAPPDLKAFIPMLDRFAMRVDPDSTGLVTGKPSGNSYVQAWFELADGRPIDPIALLTVVDTLPPVTIEMGLPGWAPTLELTVHVRATPAPGVLRIRHESRNYAGGFFEEDCEVWDSEGRLVAQSRQLALAPLPPKVGG
ncbi:MAG TPA: thioesterase family protein [Marmoricola sp.]|nr:thioesterase family protein [Marmoricola sp.]